MRKFVLCARDNAIWLYAGAAITVMLLLMK
jgi:hypothetical protein